MENIRVGVYHSLTWESFDVGGSSTLRLA